MGTHILFCTIVHDVGTGSLDYWTVLVGPSGIVVTDETPWFSQLVSIYTP